LAGKYARRCPAGGIPEACPPETPVVIVIEPTDTYNMDFFRVVHGFRLFGFTSVNLGGDSVILMAAWQLWLPL
jgi:hypothetical protein